MCGVQYREVLQVLCCRQAWESIIVCVCLRVCACVCDCVSLNASHSYGVLDRIIDLQRDGETTAYCPSTHTSIQDSLQINFAAHKLNTV